ncbi:hypothetical protein BS47DRAFT_1343100 [Hydnum rufescens UP504]|uniref:Pkinase-domain-containing protein n=1 Tax=Hydnum rufescens UP504 TaxID=1448309 RepID=A0A9P6AYU4_9AGAM|nr:hypothetical protein BS47DRAFT_1343100 [Hydnum rufescens UP504]
MFTELVIPSEVLPSGTPTSEIFSSNGSLGRQTSPFRSGSGSASPAPSPTVSLDCPPGLTHLEWVKQWSDPHVSKWLSEAKVGHHATRFRENDIRGDLILDLDQTALKETGIISVGDRIKILVAVKALRQKCMRSTSVPPSASMSGSQMGRDAHGQSSTTKEVMSGTTTGRRLDTARPPPLHITESASRDLPQLVGSAQGIPATAKPTPTPRYPPPPPRQRTNGNVSLGPPLSTHTPGRRTPEPHAPPPFTKDPLPPAPTQTTVPSAQWHAGDYGLPARPNPGNLLGGTFAPDKRSVPFPRSASPLPSVALRSIPNRSLHQKSPSMSQASKPLNPAPALSARPGTSGEIGSTSSTISHPYQSSNHAIRDRDPIILPTLHVPNSGNGFPLSPIVETSQTEATTPITRGLSSTHSNSPSQAAPKSLEELRRLCVKFILADEGHSRVINVGDCQGGVQVIENVLKKMNKIHGGPVVATENEDGALIVDGWAVYLELPGHEGPYTPLTEQQLLSVCHADSSNPSRERGLTLRRYGLIPRKQVSKLEHFFGVRPPASQISPTSPTTTSGFGSKSNLAAPDSDDADSRDPTPRAGSPGTLSSSGNLRSATSKQLARASTISVMSGLGLLPPPPLEAESSPTKNSQSGSFLANPQKKLRSFFGQRPPSELITSHLGEFFPHTEKKVLERTARNSMLRGSGSIRRESIMSGTGPLGGSVRSSWNLGDKSDIIYPVPRRSTSPRSSLSGSSRPSSSRRQGPHPSRLAEEEEEAAPRLSISTDGDRSSTEPDEDNVIGRSKGNEPSTPHVLPPVSFESESLSESVFPRLRTNSSSKRFSYASEMKNKRKSTASTFLTVDEITAEMDNRQNGSISDSTVVGTSEGSTLGQDPNEDEEDTAEETSDEGELSEGGDVESAAEDDVGKAVTSTGRKRSIKWIKGALIGSGSFGSVYLGMDAFHGLLMAVKQVELPTGSSHNEERKKSMLSALEREIELLKDLQHPNIVQYLDSSMDEHHLNIFLEYVPGGSVVALLRNYGAFEEELVRNWVSQILAGLVYLHERDIIHRDIKGANILVDNKGGIKISDFGISKKVEDNLLSSARVHRPSLQGSVFWMAPEVVKQTSYTSKADIWSLGCLVVEMLTGEHPWAKFTQMQAIFKIGSSAKPETPPDISPEAEDFLNKAFELDHTARPSAQELLKHAWLTKASLDFLGESD